MAVLQLSKNGLYNTLYPQEHFKIKIILKHFNRKKYFKTLTKVVEKRFNPITKYRLVNSGSNFGSSPFGKLEFRDYSKNKCKNARIFLDCSSIYRPPKPDMLPERRQHVRFVVPIANILF